ncbi:hypothetical protein [uncultured Maricaulis sp.]|uniref:hypothetical protein n=1 Tax=uncultured Maricaulis sp. TaxID=174710 RepID=UPI0030D7E75B|tara:strand:+ start:41885 stop:42724 length:840 start_codon:yes stop_codon:yes gene_type:complete
MKHVIVIALVCAGLTACATTGTGAGIGGGVASSAFDYAPARASRAADTRFGYRLAGDEWQGRMVFESVSGEARVDFTLDAAESETDRAELLISMPYLDGGVRRYDGVTDHGRAVFVQLQAGPCHNSDGDIDPYFVTVRVGDAQMNGCAMETAPIDRWANYLADYLPAIDVCLAEMAGEADHVSLAYTLTGGATAIRLVDHDGSSWECATRDDGSHVNSLRAINAADAILGEGDPIFVRAFMPDASDSCYVFESVREGNGDLIGALGYDVCDAGRDSDIG